jgi:hypothetical protein
VHGDDLAISTYGRGRWILDNIAPIRALTREMLAAPVSLLPPVTAMRVRWDNWEDTPLPIETPSAKNPVDGVLIDYYLRRPIRVMPELPFATLAAMWCARIRGT